MAIERFVILRGASAGPVYLAGTDHYGDADTWTGRRDDAREFSDRIEADAIRDVIVARARFAVAVAPVRVGPGPDRPFVHGEAA